MQSTFLEFQFEFSNFFPSSRSVKNQFSEFETVVEQNIKLFHKIKPKNVVKSTTSNGAIMHIAQLGTYLNDKKSTNGNVFLRLESSAL